MSILLNNNKEIKKLERKKEIKNKRMKKKNEKKKEERRIERKKNILFFSLTSHSLLTRNIISVVWHIKHNLILKKMTLPFKIRASDA